MYHRRRIIEGVGPVAFGIPKYRCAQRIRSIHIGLPYAFVDHFFNRQLRFPLDIHANFKKHDHDASILADGAVSESAHSGVHQHLR